MKKFWLITLLLGSALSRADARQDVRMPVALDRLASKASESVDVTLDSSMLQLASKFLSNDDPDQAKVKRLVGKIRGVYVRSFEFEKAGEYSLSDVEGLREQLKGPSWSRIVGVRSTKGDNSDVFVKHDGDKISGLVVISAEPKELTVVHIDGPIDLDELTDLSGHLGIPKMSKRSKDQKKEE